MSHAQLESQSASTTTPQLTPLFLISAAGIGYEIALTRFFAVSAWSDYGYWVISIAMAGFAASGVVLALARDWAVRHGHTIQAALPTVLIVAAALGFTAAALNPFNPLQLQNPVTWAAQLWNIGAYYAALLPFFFATGLFVSLSFVLNSRRIIPIGRMADWDARGVGGAAAREIKGIPAGRQTNEESELRPAGISKVYAWDLTGAGAGAAAILALMFVLHPFHLIPALLLPIAVAALLMNSRRAILATALALILGEALLLLGPQARISEYKPIFAPLHTPGARTLATRLSPAGAYSMLDDFTERLDADVSNNAAMLGFGTPPRSYGLYRDGERIAALPKQPLSPNTPELAYAAALLDALPYTLKPHPSVLLIGAGGGFRIAEALRLGATNVTVTEPEPLLRAALAHGLGPSPRFPPNNAVTISAAPARAALSTLRRYDLIDLSADLLTASPPSEALFSENALTAALAAVTPGGIVSVPVSIREFPVYALRMLVTARAAIHQTGGNPAAQIILYRSAWNARLLLSNRPFTAAAIAAARHFCDQRSFDVSWYPGIDLAASRSSIYNDLPAVSFSAGEVASSSPDDSVADEAAAVLANRPTPSATDFDLRPITLDRPAFFSVLRLDHLGTLLRRLEVLPQPEIGALVNLAVLAQAAVIALIVLLLPLAAPRKLRPVGGHWAWVVMYFPALALGFLFIEIALISEASQWLEDRTSAFAVVLTGMLIFSGLGSAASARLSLRGGRTAPDAAISAEGRTSGRARTLLAGAALLIVAWTVAMAFVLPTLILATLTAPWIVRAALLLLILAPLSCALGLFFPLGLARLGDGGALPWAWALNGAFSVLATPLANLVAREFGFSRLLLAAALLYVAAALCFPAVRRSTEWSILPARQPGAD